MGNPLVTIVTPSYNQAPYLEATIRSVLEQDYPNLEYMVFDGGSDDGSPEIIKQYADRLAYWVSEPDKGQADAINKGFGRASGEIVAWLNSDDMYLPGTIRRAVDVFQQRPEAGFVYADLLSINARGEHVNTIAYRQYALEDLLAFFIIGQPSVFIRRAALDKVGPLATSFNYLLDHQLWLRLASEAPFLYVREPWAAARYHPMAKNIAQAGKFGEEAYRILEWASTVPRLAAIMDMAPDRIWGGAHRFNARYLLDGSQAKSALQVYRHTWERYPEFALQNWHRILFSFLSMVGLDGLRKLVYRRYFISAPPVPESPEPDDIGVHQKSVEFVPRRSGLPRETLPPILVTGVHRSSTTWVGKMLAANRKYTYVSEPLNILHRKGVMRVPTERWYTYICEDNEDRIESAFYETMNLHYHTWQELKSLRSLKDAARMGRDWTAFKLGRLARSQVLLKDPFAVFSAKWFSQRLGCKVVIVTRHPAAFVSSLKRLRWPFEFEDLLAQPLLMRDWLEPFRSEMEQAIQEPEDLIYQACLLWRIIYQVVWQHSQQFPEFQVVRHEDLSLQPLEQFQALYDSLGVPFTKDVAKRVYKSTSPGNPTELPLESIYSVNLDSQANLKNWQKRLTADEINRIRELTADVANRYYSPEDWN